MGNNHPRERNMGDRLRCCLCDKVLPPCYSFSDLYLSTVHGRRVYVFNGGEYFRPDDKLLYECEYCFNKPIRDKEKMKEEEKRKEEERRAEEKREEERHEEERRKEEEQKIKEQMAREAEEKRRQEDLNQRLKESNQRAQEQREKQQINNISEEIESKTNVLISQLDEFEDNAKSDSDMDELLETFSSKYNIPIQNLSLAQLTHDQLKDILSALDKLLFHDWINAPPSHSTLQHAQVFITELCALSLGTNEGLSLQNISNHVQSLVETISQSAGSISEGFMLTQALFLNLMHFFNDHDNKDTDATAIAKRWAEKQLSTEDLFLIEFLSTLTLSLQTAVERSSMFILEMEIQCLKLLLLKLTHLNDKESHTKSTDMLLRLVQANQWTPAEAVNLLKALSEKYAEDSSITAILTLVNMHHVQPDWTDGFGHTLIHALESAGPERFRFDFQKSLRQQDESSLDLILAQLKKIRNLDDSVINIIKNITTGVLHYSEIASKDEPFMTDSFQCANLKVDDLQTSLSRLCKAVFDIKGWWPTVQQMVRWCESLLSEKRGAVEQVFVEEDPCVMALLAATQVFMGNKVDLVLSSGITLQEQATCEEWSDFYNHLGISLNTNMNSASQRAIYEADIVYGTMDAFVSDYFHYGLEVIENEQPWPSRGLIIEERCLSDFHNLELSRLKENNSLASAVESLQSLMGNFHSEDIEVRSTFIKAFFQVLHPYQNKDTQTDNKIVSISQKLSGIVLPVNEVYILAFFESLLRVLTEETELEEYGTYAGKWCLEILFARAVQYQHLEEQAKELFQTVSNLVAEKLWSPTEALSLLGVLTDHHWNEDIVSIMKILHLLETYQVSTEWKDENNQSLLELFKSSSVGNLTQYLEKSLTDETEKNIDCLFHELKQMENIDEQTLEKSRKIVSHVRNLIETGEIENHRDAQQARNLSNGQDPEDLQEVLAVLCNAVHLCKAEGKWWPRNTQIISWCLLALSETGKLLEMGTGEGKSCVIAMFAALCALRGEKVDVVSSSSVLCQRDTEEWTNFYSYFGITADTNTNKNEDKDRKKCYQMDVVYGTIEAFAADHLRQIFEMKDVRPGRDYECIIIDEVDSLLLDQGVQLTYLSSPMVSMQHLNIILAMIWAHVCQYGYLSTGLKTFVQGPPASFFKVIFDSLDTEGTEITDPMDILHIAEESNIVPKGFSKDIYNGGKDELLRKLKDVSQDAMVDFFQEMEQYVPYGFTVYSINDSGLLHLQKPSSNNNEEIPDLTFLVLDEGLCCTLYDSEEILIKPIAEVISEKIQYTPCINNSDKISIPGFLKILIEKKMSAWVQNAFLAMQLRQGREYVVENDNVCPVDFRSTGIVELNKKWGDGLQQFLEIKHQIKLSTISVVTNYVSNVSMFEKYHGRIYGTTGTLGGDRDMMFLQDLYPNLSACKMPSFNRKKLFEVKGTLKTSAEEWKSEIKNVVMAQISPNSYRGGRAALVICETINKAKDIYEELKSSILGEIILYCRSDKDSLSKIDRELLPGDIIVATNLAGRGTDIKVSKQVNNNGGLFVVLTFLSENTRVELQAFGRTARKGKPGSAQVIMTTDHLQESFRMMTSLEEAKKTRDRLAAEKISGMMKDVTEMKLREDLFLEYCQNLHVVYRNTDVDEERAVVAVLNEFWGIWLQIKSDEIDQLKRVELLKSLKVDLSKAIDQSENQASPCSSIYHYIKFGNVALEKKQWDVSNSLFEKAMKQDESWAAIAFYNHAYCTIKQQKGDYLTEARDYLIKARESLKYLSEECMVCQQFVKMASSNVSNSGPPTSLDKQLTTKCTMLVYFDKNITEAINKLDDIKNNHRDAVANKSPMFSLVPNADEEFQLEAYSLYMRGLKYVFSVKEKPYFPWGALAVFFLGVLQIIGGALLTVLTFGTLAEVGMGLITEGISDCISGIESMVTGEFSWKSWAIEKAISIGISLISFGVGKLIAKGVKAGKLLIKFGKNLKSLPKFVSAEVKNGLSTVVKVDMKNVVKYTAKQMVEEMVTYGLGKAEEAVMTKILESIKNAVKKGITEDVKHNMEKEPLAASVDSIILSHLQDEGQLSDLLQDNNRRGELLTIFKELSISALQPFYADLSWQNKLNSSISAVIDRVKSEAGEKISVILTVIQVSHMVSLAADATATVLGLSKKFFSNLQEELDTFEKEKVFSEKVNKNVLSPSETELLNAFKQDLTNAISALMADALVEVFHQKFSGHLVARVQGQANGVIGRYVRIGLKTDRTEDKLRAGQNNRYIAYMPVELAGDSVKHSQSHAEKIRNPNTPGTLLDIRVLSETTGTKVIILTEDSHGKLTKMQELNPGTKPAGQTVTLIYRPKSAQYPGGHYDVHINNERVPVASEGKSCLFHALAKGMKPEASEEEIRMEADRLRSIEADSLLRNPDQWESFVKRKEWTEAIRDGDWYMAEGAEKVHLEETEKVLKEVVGQVKLYKEWQKDLRKTTIGQFIQADHQPPKDSILCHGYRDQNSTSKLAKAMLEVATNSPNPGEELTFKEKRGGGRNLPAVCVPTELHRAFVSTKYKAFRKLVSNTINNDDVAATFKLTILGAMPVYLLHSDQNRAGTQGERDGPSSMSATRLKIFQNSFQEHSKELVNTWFNLLKDKTDVMTPEIKQEIHKWIDDKKYDDQNDPYRNKVIDILSQRKRNQTTRKRKKNISDP